MLILLPDSAPKPAWLSPPNGMASLSVRKFNGTSAAVPTLATADSCTELASFCNCPEACGASASCRCTDMFEISSLSSPLSSSLPNKRSISADCCLGSIQMVPASAPPSPGTGLASLGPDFLSPEPIAPSPDGWASSLTAEPDSPAGRLASC